MDASSLVRVFKEDAWVRPFLKKYKKVLLLSVLLSVLSVVFAAGLMFTSGYMISLAAAIPFTVLALHIPSLFVRIFGIGKPIMQYFERLSSHDWVLRMTSSLRERIYVAVEKSQSRRGPGSILGMFSSDIEHVQDLFLRSVFPLITALLTYAIVVVAAGVFSPALGLLVLVVAGVVVFVLPLWSMAVNGARVLRRQSLQERMYERLTDDVLAVNDWHLSGRRDDFIERATSDYEDAFQLRRKAAAFERSISVLRQALNALVIIAVLAWSAYAFSGDLNAGMFCTGAASSLGNVAMHDSVPYAANWIAAFVFCMFPLLEALSPATEAFLGLAKHEKSVKDLNGLDSEDVIRDVGTNRQAASSMQGCAIRISNMSFGYAAQRPVFDGVSVEVPKGQHVAVIGKSGAGKSTLLDLVRGRIEPSFGQVGVNGKVGIIQQFPYVFNKSLRENLLLAKPSATDGELLRAIKAVRLDSLLARLPDGLDSMLAEGGANMSGGERHRLSLARILLYGSDVVLLDEPYLGLDARTEREVSNAMFEAMKDKTLLVVTHHMQGIQRYDRVIILGDRDILADGSPEELAKTSEVFRKIAAFDDCAL